MGSIQMATHVRKQAMWSPLIVNLIGYSRLLEFNLRW
jgi:hypothetical protein